MGLNYTATVFFGTYVPRDSKAGKRLRKYLDEGGPPGIDIGLAGAWNGDPCFITIEASGVRLAFSRGDEIKAPQPLPDSTGWPERINAFLISHKIAAAEVAPLGWHFAGSVS